MGENPLEMTLSWTNMIEIVAISIEIFIIIVLFEQGLAFNANSIMDAV